MKLHFFSTIIFAAVLLIFAGCSDNVSSSGGGLGGEWLIPTGEVFDGGPGRDGIPALLTPPKIDAVSASYLGDADLVIAVKIGGEVHVYPHQILDWHEIINDEIGGEAFAVTYCPLTGSGVGWDRDVNGLRTTFGVSGLLYNTNLIPYDRATGSNWSQMGLKCVNGSLLGTDPALIHVVETNWQTLKEMFPNSRVVSTATGFAKPYGSYPYGDYRTNHGRLIFPISNDDSRLPRKDRVLGIIAGSQTRVYPITAFPAAVTIFNDTFNGQEIVVVGSSVKNFAVAFTREIDGITLSFESMENSFPALMRDNEGTSYDIFGYGIDGPRAGQRLTPAVSFISYWFAWGTFYPGAEIKSPPL